jgi:hypothetical protein
MKQFVTGAAGFIGSNYVRHVFDSTDDEVTVYDALTYAGNLETLKDVDGSPRYSFVKGNICDPGTLEEAMAGHDAVVHFAAESHVDHVVEHRVDHPAARPHGWRRGADHRDDHRDDGGTGLLTPLTPRPPRPPPPLTPRMSPSRSRSPGSTPSDLGATATIGLL